MIELRDVIYEGPVIFLCHLTSAVFFWHNVLTPDDRIAPVMKAAPTSFKLSGISYENKTRLFKTSF